MEIILDHTSQNQHWKESCKQWETSRSSITWYRYHLWPSRSRHLQDFGAQVILIQSYNVPTRSRSNTYGNTRPSGHCTGL